MPAKILIVAYGNPLRCDDGVAWRVADALAGKFPESEVEILSLHQLAPEAADNIRHVGLVLFLDAACADDVENTRPGDIGVRAVSNAEMNEQRAGQFSHVYSPAKLLYLAKELYRAEPKAFVITVTGEDFGHGDRLSAPVAAALSAFVKRIEQIVREQLSKS
ncbi:MAG TPA: hydrogenase maturation protease [Candidatus Sulfotelmatobacter sp.]|nr:hydrogenase maturation protease [Candidatus Sulfotelmatobacter sp.]